MISNRVSQRLKEIDMTAPELARKSGIPTATIYRIISGEIKSPRSENLPALAKTLRVSIDWLVTGKIIPNTPSVQEITNQKKDNIINCIEMDPEDLKLLTNFTDTNNLMTYRMNDDSMSNTFKTGDWLLIDQGINKINKDGIYLINYENKQYVRRFQISLTNTVKMKPDNSNYEAETLDNNMIDNLTVIGKVIYAWNGHRV